jgi:hypothetical protein
VSQNFIDRDHRERAMSGAIDILRVSRLSCEWKRGTGPFRDLQQDTCGGMMSEEARVRESGRP